VPGLDHAVAARWIGRWDAQQSGYMPDREERFTALIDAVEAEAGRPDPLVLDLGAGPGSLAVRLLDRIPAAAVVAIDADPLLLALGRAAYAGRAGLRFADLDLRSAGWASRLGLPRPADAAVSTTALHWLTLPALRAVYVEVATVLRPVACCWTAIISPGTRRWRPPWPGWTGRWPSGSRTVPVRTASRRTGRPGGRRRRRIRRWPGRLPSASGGG